MSESSDIIAVTSDLETRLGQKLGLKRGTLEKRMQKAGRRLPRRVHRDAKVIEKAMEFGAHPKLRRRVDQEGVAAAHRRMVEHLERIDPKERRIRFWLGVLGGLAFNLLVIGVLAVLLLKWRGLI